MLRFCHKNLNLSVEQSIISKIKNKIEEDINHNEEKLRKHELHALLKKKIKKIHQQCMMSSICIDGVQPSFEEDPIVSKLKNSVILIEKDLGINDDVDNYYEGVSSVIHRSMASLEQTPIPSKKLHDESMVSDISMSLEIPPHRNEKEVENIDKNKEDHLMKVEKKGNEQKPPLAKNLEKKKKKNVYSSKQKVLGNLLEETYESCL